VCWTDASARLLVQVTVGMDPQRGRPSVRSQCCCDSPRWFNPEAMQYNPEIGLPFVNAPVTNGFAVMGLLAMRHSDDLKCYQPGFIPNFLTINLNRRSAIHAGIVGPRGLLNQAWSGYRVDHLRINEGLTGWAPCRAGVGWQLLPGRDAVGEALHRQGGHQRLPKAEAKQHYVQHERRISGSALSEAPSNNKMKLTKPRKARMGVALQLILVLGGPL
jgi:hypothetical protein